MYKMFLSSIKIFKLLPGVRSASLYSAENVLNSNNISKIMARLKGLKPISFQTNQSIKKAAVLIPVCIVNKEICLLYTIKTENIISDKEQVHFPGGLQKMEDKNLKFTALREAEQDIGMDARNIFIWGTGNPIVTRENISVLPVVGQIKSNLDVDKLKISQKVLEVFTVPLIDLCDSRTNTSPDLKAPLSSPAFMSGRKRIWGLTGLLTNIFLNSLLSIQCQTLRTQPMPLSKSALIGTAN